MKVTARTRFRSVQITMCIEPEHRQVAVQLLVEIGDRSDLGSASPTDKEGLLGLPFLQFSPDGVQQSKVRTQAEDAVFYCEFFLRRHLDRNERVSSLQRTGQFKRPSAD